MKASQMQVSTSIWVSTLSGSLTGDWTLRGDEDGAGYRAYAVQEEIVQRLVAKRGMSAEAEQMVWGCMHRIRVRGGWGVRSGSTFDGHGARADPSKASQVAEQMKSTQ